MDYTYQATAHTAALLLNCGDRQEAHRGQDAATEALR